MAAEHTFPDSAARLAAGAAVVPEEFQSEKMSLSMGPSHPSTHGVLRLQLEIDGETVTKADPVVGYLHRGDEKIAENMTYNQFVPYTDRLDYLAPLANNMAYAIAVERLRKDPSSLSIAVASALGNHIHVGIATPLKTAGVDIKKLKVVAFKSSGDSVAALLGGHIDVVSSTTPNVLGQLQAGKIRVIAITSANRQSGALAGVPTWKEQGVNIEFNASQGAIGPKGLSAAQIAFWENAFLRLS